MKRVSFSYHCLLRVSDTPVQDTEHQQTMRIITRLSQKYLVILQYLSQSHCLTVSVGSLEGGGSCELLFAFNIVDYMSCHGN